MTVIITTFSDNRKDLSHMIPTKCHLYLFLFLFFSILLFFKYKALQHPVKLYIYVAWRQGSWTPIDVEQRFKVLETKAWFLRLFFINPLSPHDALKHHFTALKTGLISLQLRRLEKKNPWNYFANT